MNKHAVLDALPHTMLHAHGSVRTDSTRQHTQSAARCRVLGLRSDTASGRSTSTRRHTAACGAMRCAASHACSNAQQCLACLALRQAHQERGTALLHMQHTLPPAHAHSDTQPAQCSAMCLCFCFGHAPSRNAITWRCTDAGRNTTLYLSPHAHSNARHSEPPAPCASSRQCAQPLH